MHVQFFKSYVLLYIIYVKKNYSKCHFLSKSKLFSFKLKNVILKFSKHENFKTQKSSLLYEFHSLHYKL